MQYFVCFSLSIYISVDKISVFVFVSGLLFDVVFSSSSLFDKTTAGTITPVATRAEPTVIKIIINLILVGFGAVVFPWVTILVWFSGKLFLLLKLRLLFLSLFEILCRENAEILYYLLHLKTFILY